MNVLIFIGNGFDINLGMNTRYSDFYKYYKSIKSKSSLVNNLKAEINADLSTWSDLELALGQYTKNLKSIEELDEILIDIEDKLAEYLRQVEDNFDYSEIDREKLYSYLVFPEKCLLKADEVSIVKYRNSKYTSHWFINVITFNYTSTLEKILNEKYRNIKIGSTYTNHDVILRDIDHAHGYIDERMILGVNDLSQISNKAFHENQDVINSLIKEQRNRVQKHLTDQKCYDLVTNANLICIFGCSLGDTDKLWWEKIGEQLKKDCLVIIFDIGEKIHPRRGHFVDRFVKRKKDLFLSKTNLKEEEKEIVKDKIFVGINSKIFKELKKKESEIYPISTS
jgi:hypothetical protein